MAALITGLSAGPAPAAPAAQLSGDRLMFVDCLLPAPLHKLGGKMTFLGQRHAVRATVDDCEIRGGEYIAYDRADYSTALKVWLPEAEHGDEQAAIYVGEIYEKGLGTAPDYARAAQWYERASKAGSSQGMNHLAYLYEQGLGVPQDPLRALNLYREAAGLKSDKLAFQSELDAAHLQLAELTSQLEDRTQALDASSARLEQTRAQLTALRAQNAKLDSSASELRNQIRQLQATSQSNSQAGQIDALRATLAQREQELAARSLQIERLEQSSSQQDSALARRVTELEREDGALKSTLGAAQAQAATAKSQLAAAEARQAALEQESRELQTQLQAAERSVQKAQSDLRGKPDAALGAADLKAQSELIAAQKNDLERQKTVIHNLEVERARLDTEVNSLKSSVQAASQSEQHAVQDATALRAQLASLQAERAARAHQVETLAAQIQADEAQLTRDKEQIAVAQQRAGAQDIELKRVSVAIGERETDLRKERAMRQGLEAASRSDANQIKALRAQLNGYLTSTKGAKSPPAVQVAPSELGLGANFALIIANARYQDEGYASLPAVEKDAMAVQGALERYGFKDHTSRLSSPTRDEIMNALADLAKQLGPTDSALIYYAGHGAVVDETSTTYWLPKDANPNNRASWVSTGWVTEMIRQMKARHVLVVVDSCYAGAMIRNTNVRLVSTDTAAEPDRIRLLARLPSRTVLTSGGNEPVLGSGPGGNSIFARQFIQVLNANNQVIDASFLYESLADAVLKTAANLATLGADSGTQRPRYSVLANAGHLNGDFLFVPTAGPRSAQQRATSPAAARVAQRHPANWPYGVECPTQCRGDDQAVTRRARS